MREGEREKILSHGVSAPGEREGQRGRRRETVIERERKKEREREIGRARERELGTVTETERPLVLCKDAVLELVCAVEITAAVRSISLISTCF